MQKICFFLCLFSSAMHAQKADYQFYGKSIPEIRGSFQLTGPIFRAATALPDIPLVQVPVHTPEQADIPLFFSPGLTQWKVEDLPFFCRIEHQMGKKLPLLFKFRLGSVEYVDWLEGKNRE